MDTHRVELFYSYASADEPLCIELNKHLGLLRHDGVTTFYRRQVTAGTDWTNTLNEHLNNASIILLLISVDFIDSDYCYGVEMQRALERHEEGTAHVIPILLRPVDNWQDAPFGKLQALPSNGRPVTSASWSSLDEAFANVVQDIRATLSSSPSNVSSDPATRILSTPSVVLPDQASTSAAPSPVGRERLIPRQLALRGISRRTTVLSLAGLTAAGIAGGILLWGTRSYQSIDTLPLASNYDEAVVKYGIQYGIDAQRTRFNPYEWQITRSNVKNLKLAWTAQTGDMIYSSPTVADNGRVYVGSRDSVFYAFDGSRCSLSSCQPWWSARVGGYIDSSPAVVTSRWPAISILFCFLCAVH
jgi:TIR domain/PQQ-like domain